eukprot:gene2911-3628_t
MAFPRIFKSENSTTPVKDTWLAIFWIFVWISLNMGLQFANKYLFTIGFQFPILIILTGTFATFIGSVIAIFIFKLSELPPYSIVMKHKIVLLLVAFFQAATYVLENISIVSLPISLNQIIKATGPAFIILLSYIMYKELFSIEIIISTGVIILGAVLSVLQNPEFQLLGFFYSLGSIIFASLQTILLAQLLKEPQLNTLSIVMVTAFPSTLSIIPLFFSIEYKRLTEIQLNSITIPTVFVISLAIAAFFYNVSHFYIVKYTSALYYVIVGNGKVVLIVIISSVIFHTTFAPINYVGIVVALLGFIAYNFFKYRELQKKNNSYIKIESTPGSLTTPSGADEDSSSYVSCSQLNCEKSGKVCIRMAHDNVCAVKYGKPCSGGTLCQDGAYCFNRKVCGSKYGKALNEKCSSTNECENGLYCDQSKKKCLKIEGGGECYQDSQCKNKFSNGKAACKNNKCVRY